MLHIVVCPDIICITGHAGEGSPSHDLVCAACSVFLRSTQRRLQPPSRSGILRAETKRRNPYDPH